LAAQKTKNMTLIEQTRQVKIRQNVQKNKLQNTDRPANQCWGSESVKIILDPDMNPDAGPRFEYGTNEEKKVHNT
jgi:hypothetical protein